jgi:hypothetical protein
MTTATATNGKPQRRQLSDELDRLDTILLAIAQDLPGAVTEACCEGARQAVRDAIIEIVSNPELRALIASVHPAPASVAPGPAPNSAPSRPSMWNRLKAKLAAAREAVASAASNVRAVTTARCQSARNAIEIVSKAAGEPLNWKRTLWVSLCIGLLVGVACLAVPQAVAAAVSAASVTTTSVVVQVGCWLRRAARRFGLVR